MATGFRKILEGLRLIPKAASTASEKGDLDVVTSSGKLNYHNGTTASPIVTEDHAAQGASALKNKDLQDSTIAVVDATDTSKKILFDAGGTTSTSTTITATQTNNRIITLPDATDTLVGLSTSDILTNKTLASPVVTTDLSLTGVTYDLLLEEDLAGQKILSTGDLVLKADYQGVNPGSVISLQSEVSLSNNKIGSLANPDDAQDAATKSYVDAVNIVSLTAGENITTGDAVYISTGTGSDSGRTAGRVYKLNAKNDDRVEFFGFANTTALSGATVLVQVSGKRSGLSGLSVGKPVFASVAVSGNEGAVQTTAPTAANQWVIPVGIAISATELVVNGAGSATAVKITSEVVDNLYADVALVNSNTILTNANSIVLATGGVSGITVTLPPPAAGKIVIIKKVDAGVGAITINTSTGTIDGAATKTLTVQYSAMTISCDGTNYFII